MNRLDRIRLRVDVRDMGYQTPCWVWTGTTRGNGYGAFGDGYAHRSAFVAAGGEIPQGHHVHHLCEVKLCCRPEHLQALSPGDHLRTQTSPRSRNPLRTHCIHGHEYTPENTYLNGSGRQCRRCHADETWASRHAQRGHVVTPGHYCETCQRRPGKRPSRKRAA